MSVQRVIVKVVSVRLDDYLEEVAYCEFEKEYKVEFDTNTYEVEVDMAEIHSYMELERAVVDELTEKVDVYFDENTKITQIIPESVFGFGK